MVLEPTSIVSKLHDNPKHELASNTPFILRMMFKKEGDSPLKTDAIHLFSQYLPIYQALEKRLNELSKQEPEYQEYLEVYAKEPWADRSQTVKNDIIEMMEFLSEDEKQQLQSLEYQYPATKDIINHIENADTLKLFTYFAVRCLGDSFGGQALNRYNQRIFGDDKISGYFYKSAARQAMKLGAYVNNKRAVLGEQREQQLYDDADYFYQQHLNLFQEMEAVRNS